MLRPLPYPEPEQLMVMWGVDKRPISPDVPSISDSSRNKTMITSDVAERWHDLSRSFDSIAWYRGWSFNITVAGDPERVRSGLVSAEFFTCLQVAPMLGRGFAASEMEPGNDRVILLGGAFWRRRFDSDQSVLGQSIELDGVSHTVIGVMPESFQTMLPHIHPDVDLWVPISREYRDKRRWSVVTAIGRLKPGVAPQQAQSEMEAIAKELEPEGRRFRDRGVNLVRLDKEVVSGSRQALLIAFGAVACVLLIACANLAGLLLAQTQGREKEIGIRSALGATRGRILRQLLTECLLLSVIGGVAGLALSIGIARAIVLLEPGDIPRLDQVRPDVVVLLFGLAVSTASGALFGLLPAVQFSRANVVDSLKKSSKLSGCGIFGLTPRRLLLVLEVGLTGMLLIGTGLLIRSFALLKSVDPGFETDRLLAMIVPLSENYYSSQQQQAEFARELLDRAQAIPTVESAAVSNSLPMQNRYSVGMRLEIEGMQLPEDASVFVRGVSLGYFNTMRIPLLAGRNFSLADEGKRDTAIVNRRMAEHFWPDSDAIGRRILLDNGKPRIIIGIVADVKSSSVDSGAEIEVYVPFAEEPAPYIGLVLRGSGDVQPLAAAVGAVVRGLDSNQPISDVASMREILGEFFARPRFNLALLSSFAALALTLSLIGIYALVSHSVTQRTHEIGIRMALGAEQRSVLFLLMREGVFVAVTGIVLGLMGAFATAHLLATLLFGVPPEDGLTFAAVSLLLLVACLAGTYFPARRAMKVDPIVALRCE
jgi:putative ABC transport system permease protein